jgi:hypothetical protein
MQHSLSATQLQIKSKTIPFCCISKAENMDKRYDYYLTEQPPGITQTSTFTSNESEIDFMSEFLQLSPLPSKTSPSAFSLAHHDDDDDEHSIQEKKEGLILSPKQFSNFDWETFAAASSVQTNSMHQTQANDYCGVPQFEPCKDSTTDYPRISRRASCPGVIQQSFATALKWGGVDVYSQPPPQAAQVHGAAAVQHSTFGATEEISTQSLLPRRSAPFRRSTVDAPPPPGMYSALLQAHSATLRHNSVYTVNDTPGSPNSEENFSDCETASNHPDYVPSSSLGLFYEKQPHYEPNQVYCGLGGDTDIDQNISTHPMRLSISSDQKFLDPVHNFLRSTCIEVFVGNEHSPGRGAKAHEGQMGLRCVHCKHISRSKRAKQALSYPSKTINIFESVRNFQRTHFEACEHIPDELKVRYKNLMCEVHKKIHQKYIKAYYAEAGCEIGLVDTPNGLVFGAPPNLSGTPSKKLLAIMKIAEDPAASAHLEALIFPKVDQRLENLKFSHLASQTTRQVIANCRQQKTVFVHPSDFPTISDFRFVLYHQFCPCRPPITALSRRKTKPEKWDTLSGLCCRHCAKAHLGERYHKGMYFPLDLVSLHDSSFSHNLTVHIMTCEHAPLETKEALAELQRLAAEKGATTKRGSKKRFMKKLWDRMADYYPAPAPFP